MSEKITDRLKALHDFFYGFVKKYVVTKGFEKCKEFAEIAEAVDDLEARCDFYKTAFEAKRKTRHAVWIKPEGQIPFCSHCGGLCKVKKETVHIHGGVIEEIDTCDLSMECVKCGAIMDGDRNGAVMLGGTNK